MNRIATIDIGTNTALLLIAERDAGTGSLHTLLNRQEIIRLGKGVDSQNTIQADAIERLIDCLLQYKAVIAQHHAEKTVAVATSAMRDAHNRTDVIASVLRRTGLQIEVLSGEEEAELTFLGAVAGWTHLPEPFMVIDIGGGSTELVIGSHTGIEAEISLDIGSVRITERFFRHLPPQPDELQSAKRFITEVLASELAKFIEGREMVVGVAGTIVTLGQLCKGLRHFSPEIHGTVMQYADIHRLQQLFAQTSTEEIIQMGVEQGRADVILAGTLILHQFMRLFGAKAITVSTQGLRYGVALREWRKVA
ncbi:MAG: Ppx/GppA phosphatase family protein [Chloroherpetonaceae bacterium]|nr:Ppx/GppA family phosphatase [Chloroherpetonaceae bacterium]MCS7211525.1 Ppx/GppA family phosphatase [Chloroherpetonaceae bacterium]MDW8019841.1 Ppx/GppA phosphatase family protein [Chloroherpetonaceae bacterium]